MHRLCLHLYFRQGEVLFAGQREDGCKAQIASIWIYPSFFPILLYHDKVLQVWSTPWVAHKHKEIQEPCVSTGVSQWKKWQSMFKSFGCYGNGKYFLAWIPWFSSRLRIFWRSQRNITSSHCYSITQYIEVFLKKVIMPPDRKSTICGTYIQKKRSFNHCWNVWTAVGICKQLIGEKGRKTQTFCYCEGHRRRKAVKLEVH